jgi:hypothetical protein
MLALSRCSAAYSAGREPRDAADGNDGGRTKMKADDFRTALRRRLKAAEKSGGKFVDVNSGKLHREIGGYPGPSHRMPVCCEVMRSEMTIGDRIIAAPKKGNGASLTISYRLPRN